MRHGHILQIGKPVALLAQTIGPFNEATEHYFRRSMENVAICTVRESESLRYLQSLIPDVRVEQTADVRSEEHTSELQSLMRISYAVFCLKKKIINNRDEVSKLHTNKN